MPARYTTEQIQDAIRRHGSIRKAASALGMNKRNIERRLKASREDEAAKGQRKFNVSEEGERLEVLSVSDRIRTVDDALKHGEIDASLWIVDKAECSAYECPMKVSRGEGPDGKKLPDRPTIVKLWTIRITLRRRVPKPIQDGCELLLERMKKHAPKYPKFPRLAKIDDPHMLEVSVFDAHFGKLAWAMETGQNYDLRIAERVYHDAVKQLASYTSQFKIEKILFPFGQDFFHVDGLDSATTAGTHQDTDGRYAKMFDTGVSACVKAIDYLMEIAPVECIWVPGNHDRVSSFCLSRVLQAQYRRTDRVSVDSKPTSRKYIAYGPTVIGFAHGDQEKHSQLPAIMMHESRKLMADAQSLEIHLGHLHKAKETVYVSTDTYAGGVRVRILPSLSGTDQWHYSQGYVGSARAAEAYLWSKSRGYAGHFSANVIGESIAA